MSKRRALVLLAVVYGVQVVGVVIFFLPTKNVVIGEVTYVIRRQFSWRPLVPLIGIPYITFDLMWPVLVEETDGETGLTRTRLYDLEAEVYYDYPFLKS